MMKTHYQGLLGVALAAILLLASPAGAAQLRVTSTDLHRLQESVYDIGTDIGRLRSRDEAKATQLQGELDDLREEVIYLKVKMRREGAVSSREFTDIRDRLESLRARARQDFAENGRYGTGGATGTGGTVASGTSRRVPERAPSVGTSGRANEIPVGTELDVRLQNPLSSATAQVEDRFEATTVVDLKNGDHLLVPAGSVLRGVVTSVNNAGHIDRKGSLTVSFDQLTVGGRTYLLRATVTQAIESEGMRGEAGKIGAGAGIGAIIGGILGGFKGALTGILIGAGGTIAATEGKDVELPAGTLLRVRFDSPVVIQ